MRKWGQPWGSVLCGSVRLGRSRPQRSRGRHRAGARCAAAGYCMRDLEGREDPAGLPPEGSRLLQPSRRRQGAPRRWTGSALAPVGGTSRADSRSPGASSEAPRLAFVAGLAQEPSTKRHRAGSCRSKARRNLPNGSKGCQGWRCGSHEPRGLTRAAESITGREPCAGSWLDACGQTENTRPGQPGSRGGGAPLASISLRAPHVASTMVAIRRMPSRSCSPLAFGATGLSGWALSLCEWRRDQ